MAAPLEIELKLLLPGMDATRAARRLQRLPAFEGVKPLRRQLVNRYFDTPEHDLQRQRCALRTRLSTSIGQGQKNATRSAGMWVQTFKTAGTDRGGLSQRGEWNTPLTGPTLDLQALTAVLDHTPHLPPGWTQRLQPCFETHCKRTTWHIHTPQGDVIEVALDAGSVRAGTEILPLLELELELKTGSINALVTLARTIAQALPVLPSDNSKAERGYALAAGNAHGAARYQPVKLPRKATPHQVATLVPATLFSQFTRNLAALEQRHTPEVVHQARVAWRRGRSLFKLLQPWMADAPPSHGLAPLLTALGHLRDADVALHETLPRCAQAYRDRLGSNGPPWSDAWDQAMEALNTHAEHCYRQVKTLLASPATGVALLEWTVWLNTMAGAMTRSRSGTPPHDWAIQRLQTWYRKARSLLFDPLSTESARHRGRLLAKRVRYGAEALESSLSSSQRQQTRRWLRLATAWQVGVGADRDLQQAVQVLQRANAPAVVQAFVAGVGMACTVKIEPSPNPTASGSTP